MNDLECFCALVAEKPLTSADEMQALVDKNQNGPPLGEADGSFTPEKWHAARDYLAGLRLMKASAARLFD